MQALKAATIVMAVMIVGGTALLVTLIIRRASHATSLPPATLHEPPGTHLVGIATTSAGLAVALQGGGPDRILILDATTMRETGRITVAP